MYLVVRLILLAFFFLSSGAEARSLFWQDIQVTASLDQKGRLHVREEQTMLFNGDWNGGERTFAVRPGQQMRFASISRVAADGREVPLLRGNLSQVDHWDHNGSKSIRWRSRLPSDPAFQNTEITYVLYYSLSQILTPQGDGYLLDHDFCFPERAGVVKRFRLNLEFDPVWGAPPVTLEKTDVAPGRGVVFHRQLQFSGATPPAVYAGPKRLSSPVVPVTPAPRWLGYFLCALLAVGLLWRGYSFLQWEKGLQRFEKLLPTDEIDTEWLEKQLFIYQPEVVGATWDKSTSTAEVAAILARLVVERKLKSWLEPYVLPFFHIHLPGMPPILHLKLLQPRSSFSGYEAELIQGLFVDGREETDTKTVREYYRKKQKTFDPVSKISEPLQKQMKKLTDEGKSPLRLLWVPTVVLAVSGFFLLVGNGFYHQAEFLPLQVPAIVTIVFSWIIGVVLAFKYRYTVLFLGGNILLIFLLLLLVVAGFAGLVFFSASTLLIVGVFCMAAALVNNVINIARTKESAEGLALRRKFAAARKYFQQELEKGNPEIKDSWFPYLLAFGLGPRVDSWFRQYGGNVTPMSSGGNYGGSGSSGFSGGGGAFGGGGASGSWHTAVGGFVASSSSSSSGGGMSGGSSGGGGGGGW